MNLKTKVEKLKVRDAALKNGNKSQNKKYIKKYFPTEKIKMKTKKFFL